MKFNSSVLLASVAMIALGKTGAQRQNQRLPGRKPVAGLNEADEQVGVLNAEGQKLVIIKFVDTKDMGKTSSEKCKEVVAAQGGSILYVYAKAFKGCAAYLPIVTSDTNALKNDPDIEYVEDDRVISLDPATTGEDATSWGLDRIDQCSLPLDGTQTPLNATGIKVYIVDSGITGSHDDFEGVIDSSSNCHVDVIEEASPNPLFDGNGHGTHVASAACGNEYGVARDCDLCSVKVFGASGGSAWAVIIAAVEHVMNNCADGERCVANLSLGGSFSAPMNTAVKNAVADGVTVVVAAGNDMGGLLLYITSL